MTYVNPFDFTGKECGGPEGNLYCVSVDKYLTFPLPLSETYNEIVNRKASIHEQLSLWKMF